MRFQSLPRASRQIILGTFALAAASGAVSLRLDPIYIHIPPLYLLIACVVCSALELVQIELTAEKSRMSLSFAGLLGVVMLYGPVAAALVGLVEGASGNFVRHDPVTHKRRFHWPDMVKLTFNTFNHSLSASAAGLAYMGTLTHFSSRIDLAHYQSIGFSSIVPAFLATAVYFLINTLGTAAIVATSKGLNVFKTWHENFLWTAPQSLTSATAVGVGLGFWTATASNGPLPRDWRWFLVLVPAPIYLVYHSYRLYMEKIRRDLDHISTLATLNNSVIESLATAIDAKDHYTNKHLSRVQCYALEMSKHLGLDKDEHEAVRCAALVHDIGKLGVPESILTKPGKLSPTEYERMQQHVEIGAAILQPVQFPWPVVDVVLAHHERWDGLGYPKGLKGEEIPMGARVIALADVFDALTSDRPYRKAVTKFEALDWIRKQSGSHFDPKVVDALMVVMETCEQRIAEMTDGEPVGLDAVERVEKVSNEVMEQIARANSEFFALYDVSQSLRGSLSLDGSMKAVIEKIPEKLPADTCAIFLANGTDELKVEAVSGAYADLLFGMKIAVGEGLSGRVFVDLEPIVNGPAMYDVGRKVPHTETLELNSSLVVPLRSNGQTLGTISVYHSSYNIYTEDHKRMLMLIAEHAANTIDSARRLQETHVMAMTDELTGLPNARALNNALTQRLDACRTSHETFAVVLIDLDDFKAVNDVLGHLRGDEVLRVTAAAMHACVRSGDLLARYAGDEFILVVPNTEHEQVSQLCARLADEVSRIRVDDRIHLGASIGFALFPDDGLNARDLIEIADSRMYENKNFRKNRE